MLFIGIPKGRSRMISNTCVSTNLTTTQPYLNTLKDCLFCRIYCAHLGKPWHRTVTAFRAVSDRSPVTLPLSTTWTSYLEYLSQQSVWKRRKIEYLIQFEIGEWDGRKRLENDRLRLSLPANDLFFTFFLSPNAICSFSNLFLLSLSAISRANWKWDPTFRLLKWRLLLLLLVKK